MDKLSKARPPVAVIGMDAGGLENLAIKAARALFSADVIYTSRRLSGLLPDNLRDKCRLWATPFEIPLEEMAARRKAGEQIAVLLTGDPFWYGAGAILARSLPPEEMRVHPAPSAFSLAAARMGWALQDVETCSVHGRPVRRLERHLRPGVKILALTTNSETAIRAAALLTSRGFGDSRLTILSDMGGAEEKRISASAREMEKMDAEALPSFHVLAMDLVAGPEAVIYPTTPGLPDSAFLHDGMITKQPVRAITVCALRPMPGELLWDVGAGNGSVAVEWLRAAGRGARAFAIERDMRRSARIAENALRLGGLHLEVVEGAAPEALEGLEAPDAVFIGGNSDSSEIFEICHKALKPGGVLVANAVTSNGAGNLFRQYETHGGELLRLNISTAFPLGDSSAMRPALPVTQLRLRKEAGT